MMKKTARERIFFRNANYWKPAGNVFVADCIPFYHDGVFHVYYLWDQGHHHHPQFGTLGGHVWAHISSNDLVNWEHHPVALPIDAENGECSNCTGSLLEWKGKIYAFYALRSRFFGGEERFRIAASNDGGFSFGERFSPDIPVPPGTRGQFRDPHAFIGEDGLIHILITAGGGTEELPLGRILHYTTPDMKKYTCRETLYETLRMPECSDFFRMGDFFYYTYASHWQTHYRMAKTLSGKWKTPSQDVLTSRWCAVMKSAPWKGTRRIGAAWIPTSEGGTKVFGGNMVFREIVQASDGTLGTAFVPEMIPQKELFSLKKISLSSEKGIKAVEITSVCGNFRLDGCISFRPGTAEFGVILRDGTGTLGGRSIAFDPAAGTAAIDLFDTASKIPLSSAKVPFKLIFHGGIVDLEINGNRTLVSPGVPFPGPCRIFAFVRDGRSVFQDLELYSL